MNNIRIGLMGSSCSGKTTTAEIIANDLHLEFQEEIESRLLKEWINKGRIKNKEYLHPELSREFQNKALSIREQKSTQVSRGISDRTAADLLVYNKIYVQPYFSDSYAFEFAQRCRKVMESYSDLFLFPVGVLSLEENGLRTIDREYQRKIHNSLLGVLDDFEIPYISLSKEKLSVYERVMEVKQWLKI